MDCVPKYNKSILLMKDCSKYYFNTQFLIDSGWLGVMVFEAICPELDLSDETIQKIQGIIDTNKKEIRLAYSDVDVCLYTYSTKLTTC
jgi:hypothetical protein